MRKKINITFLFWLIFMISGIMSLTSPANKLYAQYTYKKRGDRKEGIVSRRQLVAGERLVLVGAAINLIEPFPEDDIPDEFKLGVYLQDSAKVKIEMREFNEYYKMQPLKMVYGGGRTIFPWPSEIPLHYNIKLEDLYPLAKVYQAGKTTILPIALFYDTPQNIIPNYNFCYNPSRSISRLEYNIYQTQTEKLIFSGEMNDLLRERIFCIRWNGKDSSNHSVKSGLYTLIVKATFVRAPGRATAKTVALDTEFYHFNNHSQIWR